MNNQKDTSKTNANSPSHSVGSVDVQNNSIQVNKHIYQYANKKTEKLVTALYMVTDCMDSDDALKSNIRDLGVTLLRDIYKLPIISPVEKHSTITLALNHIGQIESLIEIAHTIGFVSEMNATILKKEFGLLGGELRSYQTENQSSSFGGVLFESQKNASFTLSPQLFAVDEKLASIRELSTTNKDENLKDNQTDKKTPYTMSFRTNTMNGAESMKDKRLPRLESNPQAKQERTMKILALIKDKKDIAIKDILYAFTDCSEKTIQRELNALVEKGQIKKTGAKRWSRYSSL